MIERMTGSNPESARQVARETGISQETLSRWLRLAHRLPEVAAKRQTSKTWSVDEKVRVLGEASKLSGSQLTTMLQREGLLLAELEGGAAHPQKKVDHLWEDEDDDTDEESEK